jgi:UDP-GlcNAc3NAcA epimerase
LNKTLRLVTIVGARPQFIKLGPVSRAIEHANANGDTSISDFVVHTGQHYDAGMSDVFFDELKLPAPAAHLGVGSANHGRQTARMLEAIEEVLLAQKPDWTIVYGDTNSTIAGALAAAKLHVRVAHVEAGLRSWNRAMPEEINRIATDHISDLLFAPTPTAMHNLRNEGQADRAQHVGDVMLDAVLFNRELAVSQSSIVKRLGLEGRQFGLATIHRADNTDQASLRQTFELLNWVAAKVMPLVMPLHPRTRAALTAHLQGMRLASELRLIDPVGYLDMLQLVDASRIVLTDSGGLQKEAFFLGRPCVTLRTETEWIETVEAGANIVTGLDQGKVAKALEHFLHGQSAAGAFGGQALAAFGSGNAGARIVEALLRP